MISRILRVVDGVMWIPRSPEVCRHVVELFACSHVLNNAHTNSTDRHPLHRPPSPPSLGAHHPPPTVTAHHPADT